MSVVFGLKPDTEAQERAIRSLSVSSASALADVRVLFVAEFARLATRAKVAAYLTVLTQSNVRTMLRRKSGEKRS
jgi:hypothetical protein